MTVLLISVEMAERVRMESTATCTRVLVQQVTVDATVKTVSNAQAT